MSGPTTESCVRFVNGDIDEAVKLFNERDFEQAIGIYSKCAEDGDLLSKCRMGEMYYEGLGVEKRPLKAFKLIEESYILDTVGGEEERGRRLHQGLCGSDREL